MVKKYRDLTGKYRAFRLQPDALYQSRLIQTLFNKFIKKGKKHYQGDMLSKHLLDFDIIYVDLEHSMFLFAYFVVYVYSLSLLVAENQQ